jgi:hypothetical protein
MIDLRQRQAHHEAGHAIVAIHEKFGLHFARLGDQPACMTNARLNRVWPSAVAEVRFLLAGYAADRIFAPRSRHAGIPKISTTSSAHCNLLTKTICKFYCVRPNV